MGREEIEVEIEDNEGDIHHGIFSKIWKQACEMISGYNPYGVVRISYSELIEFGYTNRNTFEEEVMCKINSRLEDITNIDIEYIKNFFMGRILYIMD